MGDFCENYQNFRSSFLKETESVSFLHLSFTGPSIVTLGVKYQEIIPKNIDK